MAYGQTGTGKTYTLGRLGEEDTSARGIMVRSMEDILTNISPQTDSVLVSYLQVSISRGCSHGGLITGWFGIMGYVSSVQILIQQTCHYLYAAVHGDDSGSS